MDQNIKVDFNTLGGAATDISGQAAKVQSELDNLKDRLRPVIAQWEGGASGAYQEAQAAWDQSAGDLQQVLAQVGSAVAAATEAYQAAEQKNLMRW